MGKKIDLSGQKFGSWLVISESSKKAVGKSKPAYWDCQCLGCNKIYPVESRQLRTGRSTKCQECRLKEWRQGMMGERFGDWLVLRESHDQEKSQNLFWDCRCLGCDRVYSVSGTRLRQGKTKSCSECAGNAKIDLTEQIIHNWLVLKESAQKKGAETEAYWDCECLICHTTHSIPGGRLRGGKTQKCRECYLNEVRPDLTEQKFGAWVVEGRSKKKSGGHVFWDCRCLSCNKVYAVNGSDLRLGRTTICKNCFADHARKNTYYEYNEQTDRFQNKNYRYFTNDEIIEFPVKEIQ